MRAQRSVWPVVMHVLRDHHGPSCMHASELTGQQFPRACTAARHEVGARPFSTGPVRGVTSTRNQSAATTGMLCKKAWMPGVRSGCSDSCPGACS